MGWTPEQFKEFCAKARVKPEEALKLGNIDRTAVRIAAGLKKRQLAAEGKESCETCVERGISIPSLNQTLRMHWSRRRGESCEQ